MGYMAFAPRPDPQEVPVKRNPRPAPGELHIGEILKKVLQEKGMEPSVRAYRAVVFWAELVGDRIAGHAWAVEVDKGRLIVEVENAVWMHELRMQERHLRARLNAGLGEEVVTQIRFRLGTRPEGHGSP